MPCRATPEWLFRFSRTLRRELNAKHLAAPPNYLADAPLSVILQKRQLEARRHIRGDLNNNLRTVRRDIHSLTFAISPAIQQNPRRQMAWLTFLRNHAPDIAAMDLFVVPTIGFKLVYGFMNVRLDRRDIVWINVTTNPTAEWVARQITEAFPWDGAPRYMIRDRDRIYGTVVTRRLRAMGIRDKPIAPASPWQNGFAERWE